MRTVSEPEHAPQFDITYDVPDDKVAHDQAAKLRAICAPVGKRSAGRLQAWSAADALRQAKDSNMLPRNAVNVQARQIEHEEEAAYVFAHEAKR